MDEAVAFKLEHESDSIASIARKFSVNASTLSRRLRKAQKSKEEHDALYRGKLNKAQEAELIKWIDRLSHGGCPPTHSMLRNFADEISGKRLAKTGLFAL
jgi:transposase